MTSPRIHFVGLDLGRGDHFTCEGGVASYVNHYLFTKTEAFLSNQTFCDHVFGRDQHSCPP